MTILTANDAVIVSRESLGSEDVRALIDSNIGVINTLRREHLTFDEISRDALRSYYVDYYHAEVMNGGFSQFVYNSKWQSLAIDLVKEGLASIGATRHLALFRQGEGIVTSLGARLRRFFSSDYFGTNRNRDQLDLLTSRFYELDKKESLEQLNALWLKTLPNLLPLSSEEMKQAIAERVSAVPDMGPRIAKARANEPAWLKQIRALCAQAGQELSGLNAGDPTHEYLGKKVFAHHFSTDHGHHYMIEVDGQALMFSGRNNEKVAEIDV